MLAELPVRWRPFFVFLTETGARIGEALEVRWSDVDRGRGTLTIARQFHRGTVGWPKGRKTRRIRLSARLDAILWELRKGTRAGDDELVFTADRGGRIDQKNLAARVLKPALADAVGGGVGRREGDTRRPESWAGFHTFRHTCATQLFRSGWNAAQVSTVSRALRSGLHAAHSTCTCSTTTCPSRTCSTSIQRGNTGATEATETDRNPEPGEGAGNPLTVAAILRAAEA